MGCGVSKLEPDDESPSGIPPTPLHRRRLIHRRRNGRLRKDCIVSSAELLRTDSSEAGDDEGPSPPLSPVEEDSVKASDIEPKGREADGDDERRRVGFRAGSKGRRVGAAEDEDFPGSPSFRFYFEGQADAVCEDGSFKAAGEFDKTKEDDEFQGTNDRTEPLNSIKKDKSAKKDRGGKFRALTKGPNAVYGLLNGRNSSSSSHHSPPCSRINHDLVCERGA